MLYFLIPIGVRSFGKLLKYVLETILNATKDVISNPVENC